MLLFRNKLAVQRRGCTNYAAANELRAVRLDGDRHSQKGGDLDIGAMIIQD